MAIGTWAASPDLSRISAKGRMATLKLISLESFQIALAALGKVFQTVSQTAPQLGHVASSFRKF